VLATEDDLEMERAFARVEEAIGLIRSHAPWRYDRIRRDLACIWVRPLPGPWASYNHGLRACQLDSRFVLDQTKLPSQLAAAIVHGATHARLESFGIGYDAAIRARVETVCLHAEQDFAQQLPDGAVVQTVAEGTLQLGDRQWTDQAMRDAHYRGSREALEYRGLPAWLTRSLELVARLLDRMRRRNRAD
jgi:hypothetical protein